MAMRFCNRPHVIFVSAQTELVEHVARRLIADSKLLRNSQLVRKGCVWTQQSLFGALCLIQSLELRRVLVVVFSDGFSNESLQGQTWFRSFFASLNDVPAGNLYKDGWGTINCWIPADGSRSRPLWQSYFPTTEEAVDVNCQEWLQRLGGDAFCIQPAFVPWWDELTTFGPELIASTVESFWLCERGKRVAH